MNYLGLDYGEKHVGVALAQGPLAEPLQTLPRSSVIKLLKTLIVKYTIDALIIGDCPESFLNQLSQLGLPIHQVDETLSTIDATLSMLHTSQSRRRNLEHAAAAALILQNWLDFRVETY